MNMALDVGDPLARVAFIPGAIQVLCDGAELHDEVAGQILPPGLPALFLPQADESGLVAAHDDPGVGTADEGTALKRSPWAHEKSICAFRFRHDNPPRSTAVKQLMMLYNPLVG
jgi:hypothetical protein